MRTVRLAAVAVALVGAASLLVPAAGARNPKDPLERHTPADTVRARGIALTRSYLGVGWKATKATRDNSSCRAQPDESDLVETASFNSPDFVWRDGATRVGSTAQLFRTVGEAAADWRRTSDRAVFSCLTEAVLRAGSAGVKVSIVSRRKIRLGPVAPHARAWRIVADLRGSARTVRVYFDIAAVGRGRAAVTLYFLSYGGNAMPLAGERVLAGRVAARLTASHVA